MKWRACRAALFDVMCVEWRGDGLAIVGSGTAVQHVVPPSYTSITKEHNLVLLY